MRSRQLALWIGRVVILAAVVMSVVWAAPVKAQGGADATVIPDVLNLRTGPGNEYAVVVELQRAMSLTLLARDDIPSNGIWVWAQTVDGVEGWALSDYLNVRAGLNILELPVRQPSGEAAPAQPAAPAAEPADAQAVPAEQAAPVNFPEGTGVPAQIVGTVNLRSGPGTEYGVVATLSAGLSALAMGRNTGADWLFVSVNGQAGWVYYTYIQLLSSGINQLPVTDGTTIPAASASQDTAADTSADTTTTGNVSIPAPVASGPGLAGFGFGGHVESFSRPDLMGAAGMTWAKRQLRFAPGADGGSAAGMIQEAHGKGFKILLSVVGHPADINQPGYFDEYARFVGEVAAQGPDAIEVWNEMNLDREWPAGRIDPGLYTQLLAKAYNAIKTVNPNIAVISGAPSPTGAEGAFGADRVMNDDRYIQGMAAAGAAKYMDCLGAHYNEGIVAPGQTSGDPRGDYYTRYFWGMVNTYWSAFGGSRPICFTELGYVTPEGYGPLPGGFAWGQGTSVAQQAQWLAEAVSLAKGSGKVKLVIIWNVDFANYDGDPMAGYAIIRPGGVCPACDALAKVR
ncbi:MAG: SH3 domain-containing protein [Anaerolineae bacterium]|nr:SH3 domain-containing protein [Anaerolineae bacterium]